RLPQLAACYASVTVGTAAGYVLAVVVGVNSVIALYYYANVARTMFMDEAPDGDRAPIRVPVPLVAAVTLSVIATVVIGFAPGIVGDLAEHATFALRSGSRRPVAVWVHPHPHADAA